MSQNDIPTDILAMPIADRIELVAKIWDSIADDATVKLSDEDRVILEQRLAEHRKSPDEGISWSELQKELRGDQ